MMRYLLLGTFFVTVTCSIIQSVDDEVIQMNIKYPYDDQQLVVPPTDDDDDGDGGARFMVLGDWGGLPYTPFFTKIQKSVAARMADVAASRREQFIVALGDNFYFDGVNTTRDPRFKDTFEDVYTMESLYKPWYVLAGNHDHHGNVTAQIEYSRLSPRWNFPDYNYTFVTRLGSAHSARFVMIDTAVLCGLSDRDFVGQAPQGPENPERASRMLDWIQHVLSQSRDDYLFVCGHYPVYSIGHHGSTQCLVRSVMPLLHRYNVTAYLNGHDHNLQHIQYTDSVYGSTVDYFTVGAANFINPETTHRHTVPHNSLRFFWADMMAFGAFGSVQLEEGEGTITLLKASGSVLYKYGLRPRMSPSRRAGRNSHHL